MAVFSTKVGKNQILTNYSYIGSILIPFRREEMVAGKYMPGLSIVDHLVINPSFAICEGRRPVFYFY